MSDFFVETFPDFEHFYLEQLLLTIGSVIIQLMDGQHQDLASLIRSQHQYIVTIIEQVLGQLDDIDSEHHRQVIDEIQTANAQSTNVILGNQQSIQDQNRAVQNQIAALIVNSSVEQESGIERVITTISNILQGLEQTFTVQIDNQVIVDKNLITAVTDQLATIVADENETNRTLTETFEAVIRDLISVIQLPLGEPTRLAVIELVKIWEAIWGTGTATEVMNQRWEDLKDGSVFVSIARQLNKDFEPGFVDGVETVQDRIIKIIGNIEKGAIGSFCSEDLRGTQLVDIPFVDLVIKGIVLALQLAMVPIGLAQQRAQICLQEDGIDTPWNILQEGDVITALFRGLMSTDQAILEMRRAGYDSERVHVLLESGYTIPDITFLFSMWFRNEISEDTLTNQLKALGYEAPMVDNLKTIAFFIPPVQDLITMAVREVFSPEISVPAGQFQDLPPEFVEWSKQQGVSEFWAGNYWAAHWSLPSPQMGFEMLHRQVIDESELKTLLRALDVMPAWRQPLVDISYTPFTRVDIRRMHKLGVLSDAEVKRAYRDIGYNPKNAALQLEFVKRLNDDESLLTLDIASDLTRGSILTFYKRGIITKEVAALLLAQAGINVGAIFLFLENIDFELELRDRQNDISLVLDRFKVEETSFTQATDQLNAIGLASAELEDAKLELERLRIGKVKMPSKADLDKFLKAGMITVEEYQEQLERQGYSITWTQRYLSLNTGVPIGA